MIPRTIHYIWFGGNPMRPELLNCLKSWEKVLLGYEIILWNEQNNPKDIFFLDEMLRRKQWAFASDFLRFYVLFNYGGIYLDTDMYFYKNIDEYLNNEYFLGKEDEANLSAGVIGSVKKHPYNEICMNYYLSHNTQSKIENFLETRILIPEVLNQSYSKFRQGINLILILESDIFYPISFKDRKMVNNFKPVSENTKAVHLWIASWHNEFELLYTKKYILSLRTYFKNLNNSNSKLLYSKKYFSVFIKRIIYLTKHKMIRSLNNLKNFMK